MAHYTIVITKALDGFRQGSSVKHYENDESSPSDGNRRRIYVGRGRSTRKTSWRKGGPKVAPRIGTGDN